MVHSVVSKAAMPSKKAPVALLWNPALLQTCHCGSAGVQSVAAKTALPKGWQKPPEMSLWG